MTETWSFLESRPADAATNMALDEALLRTAAERGRPLLRLYSWEKPAVSFGYFQKFPVPLADKYEIVRRSTGGGLVYHGDGVDTTYAVVVPPEHRLYTMSTADAYGAIHKAVAAACELCSRESQSCARVSDPAQSADRKSPEISRRSAVPPSARSGDLRTTLAAVPSLHKAQVASSRGQYECFQKPDRGDVVVDGRKLAGAAQRRTKWGLLHQGSIAASVTAESLRRGFRRIL